MLRLTEILLFLSPFVLVAVWLLVGRRLAVMAYPALAVAVVLAGLLIVFGLRRSMRADATYVPAHVEDGRIVDGHAR